MAHPVTIDWERPADNGGWRLLRRLPTSLEPQSRQAMPPNGGHRVTAPADLALTTADRAIVNGRIYPVVSVEAGDEGGSVVTLAVPDRTANPSPAATPTQAGPEAGRRVRVSVRDEAGEERVSGWATLGEDSVTLEHDYEGVDPQPGWSVTLSRGGKTHAVKAVDGRRLEFKAAHKKQADKQAEPTPAPTPATQTTPTADDNESHQPRKQRRKE
jgi:hypothetical protein